MNNACKFILLTFLFLSSIEVGQAFGQSFFRDYVKYDDSISHPSRQVSMLKLYGYHKQFAWKCRHLFRDVKRKNGVDMLNCDSLLILFRHDGYHFGNYSVLIRNGYHCCYYENPRSQDDDNKKKPMLMQADAKDKLLNLAPALRDIVQRCDMTAFKRYIRKTEISLGIGTGFTIAVKRN